MANVGFFSASDDLITYLLFDVVVFGEPDINGRRTGKMDHQMKPLRIKAGEITITQFIVTSLRQGTMDVNTAVDRFCEMNIIINFLNKWEDSEDLFIGHLKRYFGALLPRTGIAFHETDRYTKPLKNAKFRQTPSPTPPPLDSHSHHSSASFIDVAVFATRAYKVGEIIELRGGLVDLTEEEDDKFRASGSKMDFSVLWSNRKDCFCLLLGPARFVNHDCRNNVEFMPIASHMKFKVVEPIAANEQIFTRYGDHYFERNNAACLCSTCEQLKRGAFSLLPPPPADSIQQNNQPGPSGTNSNLSSIKRLTSASTNSSLSSIKSSTSESSSRSSSSNPPIRSSRRSSITSTSTASSSRNNKNQQQQEEKRRSERTNAVIDDFRIRPRLIHRPLTPPPGYALDYVWDSKKRILNFVGRDSLISTTSTSNISASNLGKRKRIAEDSPPPPKKRIKNSNPSPKKLPTPKKNKISEVTTSNSSDESNSNSNETSGSEGSESNSESDSESGSESESGSGSESDSGSNSNSESGSSDDEEEAEQVKRILTPKKKKVESKASIKAGKKPVKSSSTKLKEKKIPESRQKQMLSEEKKEFRPKYVYISKHKQAQEVEEDYVAAPGSSTRSKKFATELMSDPFSVRITPKKGTNRNSKVVQSNNSNSSGKEGNERSTRRNSLIVIPTESNKSEIQFNSSPPKRNRNTINRNKLSMPNPSALTTTNNLSSSPHQTRASKPILEDLKDLVQSPNSIDNIGGWNEFSNRYDSAKKRVNRRETIGGSSEEKNETEGKKRASRLSNPILTTTRRMLESPQVLAVSGGYDHKNGKYIVKQKKPSWSWYTIE